MKILISGGAGFLGSLMADHFLGQDHQVLSIDNFETSFRENVTSHPNLKFIEGSITDRDLVEQTVEDFQPDVIMHSAASYKNPDNWEEDIATNVMGTAYVVRAAQKIPVKRFIYLQTALCYGAPKEKPITLNHPLAPFTSYSITKTAGENYVAMSGLSYVSLRLANVYGPRHYSGPMPAFYKRLKAGQKCTVVDTRRDFLDIQDFLELIDSVIENEHATGCFNVSSGSDYSIREIFERVADYFQLDSEEMADFVQPETDDVSTLLLDPSETEKTFGWKAKISLDQGLKRLLEWYDKQGVEVSYTHLSSGKKI